MESGQYYSALGKGGVYLEGFYANFDVVRRDLTTEFLENPSPTPLHSPIKPLLESSYKELFVRDCSSTDSGYWSSAATPGAQDTNSGQTLCFQPPAIQNLFFPDELLELGIAQPAAQFSQPVSCHQQSFLCPMPSVCSTPKIVHSSEFFSPQDMIELMPLLSKPKRFVPSGYLCHICNQPGHSIRDCPMSDCQPGLTPYQGSKVVYGSFICSKCKRVWGSVSSRANRKQPCVKCKVWEFPYKQMSLEEASLQGLAYQLPNGQYKVIDRRQRHRC